MFQTPSSNNSFHLFRNTYFYQVKYLVFAKEKNSERYFVREKIGNNFCWIKNGNFVMPKIWPLNLAFLFIDKIPLRVQIIAITY